MKKHLVNHKNRFLSFSGLALLICLFFGQVAQAQRADKAFGIGFQAGNPTGLALQFYRAHGVSTDILFAYNLNNFVFLNVHGLWNTHLDETDHWR